MSLDIVPPDAPESERLPPRVVIETRRRRNLFLQVFLAGVITAFLVFGVFAVKAGMTFQVVSEELESFLGVDPARLPVSDPKEQNRLDILILGFRGEGDPHGGLLTDTIMALSIDTKRHLPALISVPRDVFLTIPVVNTKAKINEAFALGEKRQRGGGLVLAKLAAQEVLGINIDYAVAVDFRAFEDTVDLLGGVDVDVAKPLRETQQWGGIDFTVPAGRQHMDGETALFYVRSRFSTSDFDRARRQQEVLLAVRNKALSLGFLANPAKLADLLDILGRHVRTDVSASELPGIFGELREASGNAPERLVLDTANGGLSSTLINGSYVLLPIGGTFDAIHVRARTIFSP